MLQAAADWENFASPNLEGRILRVAALVDGPLLAKMLEEAMEECLDGRGAGKA